MLRLQARCSVHAQAEGGQPQEHALNSEKARNADPSPLCSWVSHCCSSAGVLKFTSKPKEGQSQERALYSEKEANAADMRATIQFEAPTHVRWSR